MNPSNEPNENETHFLFADHNMHSQLNVNVFGPEEDSFRVAPVYGQSTVGEGINVGSLWDPYNDEGHPQPSHTEYHNNEWDVQRQRQPMPTLHIPYEECKPDVYPALEGLPVEMPNFGMTGQYTISVMGGSQGSDYAYSPHGSPLTATSPPTSSQGSWSNNDSPVSLREPRSLSRSASQRHSPYASPTVLRQRSLSASGGRPRMMGSMDGTDMAGEPSYSSNGLGLLVVPGSNQYGGRSAPATPAEYSPSLPHFDAFEPYFMASAPPSPTEPRQVGSEAITTATSNRRTREAKFFCETPGCGKTFTARHNLKNHMNSHNDVRNHPCQKCGNCFVTAHVKNRHEKTCKAPGPQSFT